MEAKLNTYFGRKFSGNLSYRLKLGKEKKMKEGREKCSQIIGWSGAARRLLRRVGLDNEPTRLSSTQSSSLA